MTSAYTNKQRSFFCLLPYLTSLAFLIVGVLLATVAEARTAAFLLTSSVVFALVGLLFQHMVVRDEGDGLSVRFGPLSFVRTRISYADIRKVERDQLKFVGGGMRKRSSWKLWRAGRVIWSVGGRECVVIHRQHDAVRIVTRDADKLVDFLQRRIVVA